MGLLTWVDSKISTLRWYDIGLVKLSVAAFVILIAKWWPPLISLDWYWYLIIFLVTYIILMKKMFTKSEVWVKGKTK